MVFKTASPGISVTLQLFCLMSYPSHPGFSHLIELHEVLSAVARPLCDYIADLCRKELFVGVLWPFKVARCVKNEAR